MAVQDWSRSAEVCSNSAEPAAASAAAPSAAAREAAPSSAATRVRRSERASETGREIADRKAGRTGAEVAVGRDPVDRARLVQRLGHVQLSALEYPLGDPERDAVHEVALPERQRGGRCLLESREVREVAAER